MNIILVISTALMALGALVAFGIFDRIGPVTTSKGMNRLGIALVIIGIAIGLTQSEPVYREDHAKEAGR